MKSVLFVLAMISSVPAFALPNCIPTFVGTGEAGQGYYNFPCSEPSRTRCNEGEVTYISTGRTSAEGGMEEMPVVCHNGTFVATRKPVHHRGCIEGEVTYISTGRTSAEGGTEEMPVVCHNGRFVR